MQNDEIESAIYREDIRLDNNHLFSKKPKEKYRPRVRCEDCEFRDFGDFPNLPEGYIHCLKYTNMIARLDQSCKSGTKRKEAHVKD